MQQRDLLNRQVIYLKEIQPPALVAAHASRLTTPQRRRALQ
jgi:hypothetical protein